EKSDKGEKADKGDKGAGEKGEKGGKDGKEGTPAAVLEWKGFKKGETFYQEIKTTTKQDMKVQQQQITQNQDQTFWVSWTTTDVTDKEYKVKQKILGVKMDIEIGGNKISYDSTSTDPQPANPLTDFFKALKDKEFELTIDRAKLEV